MAERSSTPPRTTGSDSGDRQPFQKDHPIDVHIHEPSSGSVTSDPDDNRNALLWVNSIETRLRKTIDICVTKTKYHTAQSSCKKFKYHILASITVILPAVATVAAALREKMDSGCDTDPVVVALTSTTTCVASLALILNYSQTFLQHADYSARWHDLGNEISFELAKPRIHRQDADVFMTRMYITENTLRDHEPG